MKQVSGVRDTSVDQCSLILVLRSVHRVVRSHDVTRSTPHRSLPGIQTMEPVSRGQSEAKCSYTVDKGCGF